MVQTVVELRLELARRPTSGARRSALASSRRGRVSAWLVGGRWGTAGVPAGSTRAGGGR